MGVAGRLGGLLVRRIGDGPIRVMIVDDSSVARAVLSRMLDPHEDIEVAAVAGSAAEALELLKAVQVDVILLDIEMPRISGLDALPDILRAGAGARVLIVSSLAEAGAEATVRALSLGAADTLPKPAVGAFGGRYSDVLAERLRQIGRVGRGPRSAGSDETETFRLRAMPDASPGCIAIGASTGGLQALNEFLPALPPRCGVPILVTQHLPDAFMAVFARQLAVAAGRPAIIAADGLALVADRIHIAPGDAHFTVERKGGRVVARLDRAPAPSGCLPSVDPMFASVAEIYGAAAVGVVLSGMGRDGLDGARRVIASGGAILAQDRSSSAVWGMPRGVAEAGLASAVLAPVDLARRLSARLEAPRR